MITGMIISYFLVAAFMFICIVKRETYMGFPVQKDEILSILKASLIWPYVWWDSTK